MGLIHTAIFISGDMADGGASIGRSAGDPRVDCMDADHQSINHARAFLGRVITGTRRNREVVDFTRYRVKNNSKLTNFKKFTRIEGYNGKYGSNPQGIKEFLDVIFKFDQIGQEIDGRNWRKMVF